jgi:hypothetical protein
MCGCDLVDWLMAISIVFELNAIANASGLKDGRGSQSLTAWLTT